MNQNQTRAAALETITHILYDFGVDPAHVTLEATFDELGIDSLDQLELLHKIEQAINANIPDSEAAYWQNIGHVVESFLQHQK